MSAREDDLRLTPRQREVAARVIAEQGAKRDHLVVYLSGSHSYGFHSPDSDLDLKAIHVAPTRALLGFSPPQPASQLLGFVDGVEIDYTSNELGHALAGMLQGNGNYLERVLGRLVLQESALLAELRPLVAASLSRRLHRHYRGFASSQLRLLDGEPTVKKLLYVLRTTLTGLHALRAGAIEPDVGALLDTYGVGDARALVEAKLAGERVAADPAAVAAWRPRLERLLTDLDAALPASVLPDEPPNAAEIEDWLVGVRRGRLA